LLRGKLALAVAVIQRRLASIGGKNRVEGAVLLELLGEAEIGQGQVEGAAERGRKLAELGTTLVCQVMFARGERLLGLALAAGANEAANRHLEAALREFVRLEMPFETARTRLLLAKALREDEPEVAEAEAHAALVIFENLGANENAGAAATLLREIETRTRKQISNTSVGLSRREVEVLGLVAQGMSNQDIADQLAISKHTVHRHVSSILTKLDLRSRAAAAAYAAQHELL
jgi:DNA-binding CsgD family transcriptional regulator